MTGTSELRIYEIGECFAWEDEEDDPVRHYACTEANTNHGVVLIRLSADAARDLRMGLQRLS